MVVFVWVLAMKSLGTYIKTTVACVVSMAIASLASALQAQAQQQGKATVYAVSGSAQYKAAGKDWAPLKVNIVLQAGTVVRTAADGQVDLYLDQNGPIVRLIQSTEMSIDKLVFILFDAHTLPIIETQLDLKAGTILGNVRKLAAASCYEIKTPRGICVIRGTEYRISDTGNVLVKSGSVRVKVDDKIFDVGPGQKFNPNSQQAETAPAHEFTASNWPVYRKDLFLQPFRAP
ncbi:MAG: FecR domain-containing protein [Deltaproteobacteria bacterium]